MTINSHSLLAKKFLCRKAVLKPNCNLVKKFRLKPYLRTKMRVQEQMIQTAWFSKAGIDLKPPEEQFMCAVPVCPTELLAAPARITMAVYHQLKTKARNMIKRLSLTIYLHIPS